MISQDTRPALSERALSDNIVNLARMLGWLVHRDPTWRATGTDPGYPDLTLVKGGRVIFMELKAEKVKGLPKHQETWRIAIEGEHGQFNGGQISYFICRPSNWYAGEVERILE